ncbi:MAG: flagellar brake protein [Fusobacteriota bacterium]
MGKDIIELGRNVEIEVLRDPKYKGNYYSRIDDIEESKDGKYLKIGLPIEKGTIIPLRIKSKIQIRMTLDDAVYAFNAIILARGRKPYAYFKIKYPEDIKRIQRRNFVRIPINLLLNLRYKIDSKSKDKNKKDEYEEFKGISVDLSGGGIYFWSNKDVEETKEVEVSFDLPDNSCYKNVKSNIVRKDKLDKNHKANFGYGIKFLDIGKKDRDNIISYLFELQRNRRKKGI